MEEIYRDYILELESNKEMKGKVGQLIHFEFTDWITSQVIRFDSGNDWIKIDLIGKLFNTQVFRLFWKHFTNAELKRLAEHYKFSVEKVRITKAQPNLAGMIKFNNAPGKYLSLAVKPSDDYDYQYVIIFFLEIPDRRSTAELYVHGIWKSKRDDALDLLRALN